MIGLCQYCTEYDMIGICQCSTEYEMIGICQYSTEYDMIGFGNFFFWKTLFIVIDHFSLYNSDIYLSRHTQHTIDIIIPIM
jgi:hypothetical protein